MLNTSYTITAEIDVPESSEGVIVTEGGRFGGFGLYLLKGKPVFCWNLLDLKRVKWRSRTRSRPANTRSSSTSNTTASASRRSPSTV
jgi:arylsulfatase